MAKTRRRRYGSRKHRGGGYGTSQQFFNPTVLPPAAGLLASVPSSAPTADAIRPVLPATFKGGARTRRGQRGGFSPSVMGGFIQNAQAAIVPAALYLVYHTFVPKKSRGGSRRRRV